MWSHFNYQEKLSLTKYLNTVINNAVFSLFFPGMTSLLVSADPPGMVVDVVERIAHVIVNVGNDVDQDDEQLEAAIDHEVLNTVRHYDFFNVNFTRG